MQTCVLTGAAGFIGYHVAERFLAAGWRIVGIDSLTEYYDPTLKRARLHRLLRHTTFEDVRADITEQASLTELFARHRPNAVIHLAAQAGVRHSLDAPQDYVDANVTGFLNVLEACRSHPVDHLIFASTSSVFGLDADMPLSVHRGGNHPISLYAATKKANEAMAHAYAHLFRIPCTGVRFFTVYGPWGRPDMALFKFTRAILADEPVQLFNNGDMVRDFTYVDDIVESLHELIDHPPASNPEWDAHKPDPATSSAPYQIFNIGNSKPIDLMVYLAAVEDALQRKARIDYLPMQPGDVAATFADTSDLQTVTNVRPNTDIADGVREFVEWYRGYYDV